MMVLRSATLALLGLLLVSPSVAEAQCGNPVTKSLVKGGGLHGANGLGIDPAGRLVVASVLGSELVTLKPQNGQILGRLGFDMGVDGPDDLIFGPDGSVYWTSLFTGNIGRRTPDGTVSFQFIAPGTNPITFSADGRLFTALDFLGDALYELDPDLQAPPRLIAQNLGFMNGMDFGPDGRLYGPIWTQGRVVSIDPDSCTNAVDPWAECDIQEEATGFFAPAAVKFDSLGRLHVVDQKGEVTRINLATGARQVLITMRPGLDNLVLDASNKLYVSSFSEGSVVEVRPNGTARTLIGGAPVAPGGIAVLPGVHNPRVYVADLFTLRAYDGKTGALLDIADAIPAVPGLIAPQSAAADGSNIILSSWFNNAVQVWDPIAKVAVETHYDVATPFGATRFQGDLVIAELNPGGGARVARRTGGAWVTLATGFVLPVGLAASSDDLYVSDHALGCVFQVVNNNTTLAAPLPIACDLDTPEGLALDENGKLLVVETGSGTLTRINPATGAKSTVATGLETDLPAITNAPPTYVASGVATFGSAIYTAGDEGQRIYRTGNP